MLFRNKYNKTTELVMKRAILMAAALIGVVAVNSSIAQDDKLKRDVTYSTHNYKHPNKAAQAQKWEDKTGIAVSAPGLQRVASADYKNQPTSQTQQGGITVPVQPNSAFANWNYKMQRPMGPTVQPRVVKKKESKPVKFVQPSEEQIGN